MIRCDLLCTMQMRFWWGTVKVMKCFKLTALQSCLFPSIMTLIPAPRSCELKFPKPHLELASEWSCAGLEECSWIVCRTAASAVSRVYGQECCSGPSLPASVLSPLLRGPKPTFCRCTLILLWVVWWGSRWLKWLFAVASKLHRLSTSLASSYQLKPGCI